MEQLTFTNDEGHEESFTLLATEPIEISKKHRYRIRKLTPRECYRLMGFKDEDFDKAEKVISQTQLYKTAGNSIVKSCLMGIFSQLNIKGVKPWNDMTDDERYELIGKPKREENEQA